MIEHVCFYQKPVDSTSYCLYYNTSDNALVAHYKWRPQPRDPGHNCLSYSNGVYGIDLHMAIHRWNKCIWKLQIQETKINPWIYLLQLSHVTMISSANCLWLALYKLLYHVICLISNWAGNFYHTEVLIENNNVADREETFWSYFNKDK